MTTVVTYYRFVSLPDFRAVRDRVFVLAQRHGVLGTILLAEEGINSTICGEAASLEAFFEELGEDPRLADFERKYSQVPEPPFHKLKVRLKTEIVRMRAPEANPAVAVGEYVAPADWNAVISDPETLVVDVRNDYEVEVGTFEGAVNPETKEFRDFPAFVKEHLGDKERPVAMFCTGGIRCEKASAYLLANGFRKVMHLQGGILNYLEKVPKEDSLWRGDCFVFDDRRAVDHDLAPA